MSEIKDLKLHINTSVVVPDGGPGRAQALALSEGEPRKQAIEPPLLQVVVFACSVAGYF